MGYRLEISKVIDFGFGSKLYGYVEDMNKLKSVQWLVANHYLEQENVNFPDWEANPTIVLRKDEFNEYIKLYYQDLNEFRNPDKTSLWEFDEYMKKLIEEDCSKLLEWW